MKGSMAADYGNIILPVTLLKIFFLFFCFFVSVLLRAEILEREKAIDTFFFFFFPLLFFFLFHSSFNTFFLHLNCQFILFIFFHLREKTKAHVQPPTPRGFYIIIILYISFPNSRCGQLVGLLFFADFHFMEVTLRCHLS